MNSWFEVEKVYKTLAITFATLVLSFGLIFLFSWHLGYLTILEFPPALFRITYESSLCLFLTGLAILFLFIPIEFPLTNILGIFILFIMLSRGVELTFNIKSSFIHLINPWLPIKDTHSMPTISVICFIFIGCILTFFTKEKRAQWRRMALLLLSQIIAIIAIGGLITFLIPQRYSLIWSGTTALNFYGVLNLLFIGMALVSAICYFNAKFQTSLKSRLPILITITLSVLAMLLAWGFNQEKLQYLRKTLTYKLDEIKTRAQFNLKEQNTSHLDLNAQQIFDKAFENDLDDEYAVIVYANNKKIYEKNTSRTDRVSSWETSTDFSINDQNIQLKLYPTEKFFGQTLHQTYMYALLITGFIIAIYGGVLAHLWQLSNQKMLEVEELAAIITTAKLGIYTLTPEGLLKSWNRGAEEIYGWTADEVIGKPIDVIYSQVPLKKLSSYTKSTEKTLYNHTIDHFKIQLKRKDGQTIWIEKVLSSINDPEGNVIAIVSIDEDITEEVTEQSNIERSKNEFISIVNHELRTPLTSIFGALGLLLPDQTLSTKQRELISIAHRNTERLISLTKDIIDIEKFALGKFELFVESISICDIIDESIASAQSMADKFNVRLAKEGNFTDVDVNVDKKRLIQVFLNLLSNAIKFSPIDSTVFISMQLFDKTVRVCVRDQGKGISEKFKSKIFEKFAQEDISDKRSNSGTGLGLNISKNLIELMGGQINFISEIHKGSTFFFDLPIKELK